MAVTQDRSRGLLAALALAAGGATPAAHAADILGLYVGGAAGEARVEAGPLPVNPAVSFATVGDFAASHSAYQLLAGIRPLPIFAVEAAYVDFGHPSAHIGGVAAPPLAGYYATGDVHLSGSAAYGVLYLPIPVVDVYAKAGMARLKADANSTVQLTGPILCPTTAPQCRFTQSSSTSRSGFTAGAGVGLKLGPIQLRAEYERFTLPGGYPSLATLGITYTFL